MSISKLCFVNSMWIQYPFPFLKYLNNGELALLAYLMNWAYMKGLIDERFFCKASQITEELFITKKTQTNLIKSLEKKKFIFVEREGFPQVRWIRFNWEHIEKLAQELNEEVSKRRNKRSKTKKKHRDRPFEEEEW